MNNNLDTRLFQQQGERPFHTTNSGNARNVDDCTLPSSNYLAPKDHIEPYDYSSMMYRQHVHEVKYRDDFSNTAANRVQYY